MVEDRVRRAALVERLADHVLAHGLAGASLRPLAAAAGTSDRMLLYYFSDKAELIATVLGAVAERMTAMLDAHRLATPVTASVLEARLLPFVLDDMLWPFMALWLEVAGQSARGDPVCRRVGEAIARGFLAWTEAQVSGRSTAARQKSATRVLMSVEGAVLLKSLGLGGAVTATIQPAGRRR